MASRFAPPIEITERSARNGRVEVVLEPIDEIATSASDFRDGLTGLIAHAMEMSERLGKLLGAIEAERERQILAPLMTTHEVAAYLKTTDDSVRELRQRGKLKAAQVLQNSPRYRQADVIAFVESVRGR